MRKNSLILYFALSFILAIGISSATIEINQLQDSYNFGDNVFLNVNVKPNSVSGNFEINMICSGSSINLYKISPAESAFSIGASQKINHKIILTKEFLGALSGYCKIGILLGEEQIFSNDFYITNEITLSAKSNKEFYAPGEIIRISLDAKKSNGQMFNGIFNTSKYAEVGGNIINGIALIEIPVEENTPAGEYEVSIDAYDKVGEEILNRNNVSLHFGINQVPKKLDVSLLEENTNPGNEFFFSIDLIDQSGEIIKENIDATITDGKKYKKTISASSGEINSIIIENNSASGEYTISSRYNELKVDKKFNINEIKNIDIEIIESTGEVRITNIGNVLFDDYIEIKIGENAEKIHLILEVGEKINYMLSAPNGEYDVSIKSENSSYSKILTLTGNAISIKKIGDISVFRKYPIVWIFIIIVLLSFGIILFLRNKNLKLYDYRKNRARESISKKENTESVSKKLFQRKKDNDSLVSMTSTAKSVPTLKGNKHNCSIVSLKINNIDTLSTLTKNKINEIVSSSIGKNGAIDYERNHITIIYSPLMTKTYQNEIIAVKSAVKIKKEFDEYNKNIKEKINYNIGINSGEMVLSNSGKILLYTNLENGTSQAKKISELSNEKILLSKFIRQKLARDVKANISEFKIGENEIYELISVTDADSNKEKLKDLLKRTNM